MTKDTVLTNCLIIELSQPLIDEIVDHWQDAFKKLLPAVFRDLRVKSAQVMYDLSDEADQRMQPNMTESARQKLRLQARAQIESIHEEIEGMRENLIASDSRENMRDQLTPALEHEMRQAWKDCVKTIGRSSPSSAGIRCAHTKLNRAQSDPNRPGVFPTPAGHRGPSYS